MPKPPHMATFRRRVKKVSLGMKRAACAHRFAHGLDAGQPTLRL